MKTVGIISEYDPFHNGHKYQCDELRRLGAETIISIMGGSFSQRGSVYILDKYTRAKCAVASGGADIVLELPYPFSASAAENFASAGVYIASKYCDSLAFGCECENGEKLIKIAKTLLSDEFITIFKNQVGIDSLVPAPLISCAIISRLLGDEYAEIMKLPNNILAIEYLKAIFKGGYDLEPIFIHRNGAMHGASTAKGSIASSSLIRKLIFEDKKAEGINSFCPEETYLAVEQAISSGSILSLKNAEKAILYSLRNADFDSDRLSECGGGLGNRILNNASIASSLEELYEITATKRYTNSRIRRATLSLLFKASKSDVSSLPEFTSILAAKKESHTRLKDSELPLLSAPSDIRSLRESELVRLYIDAERFVSLCYNAPTEEYAFFKKHPVIL